MNIYDLTVKSLESAITYKEIIDYLEGINTSKIYTDPRDMSSPHAYNFSLEVYNKYAKEHPELNLKELFEESLLERLNSEQCNFIDVYSIYCCIISQLRLQKSNRASFKVDDLKLNEIFKLLREKTLKFKEILDGSKWDRGKDYEGGAYEYMQLENEKISQEIGRRIL